ncbi:MAG: hypothetical protein Q4G10_07900 [Bacteroidia bacterium]|nr:hypothetical protein [Bacteroidia bacterium]
MRNFILLFLLFLSVACGTIRQVTPREQTTVEIRTETVYVPDTVYIELPRIVEKVQTLDTTSVLENKYSKSEAQVSNGVLAHSLEVKPVREPAIVQKQIVYKDSIIVKEVDIDHYIEVPAELTAWQSFKIKLGGYAFALIITLIVCAAIYFVSHSKLFKL